MRANVVPLALGAEGVPIAQASKGPHVCNDSAQVCSGVRIGNAFDKKNRLGKSASIGRSLVRMGTTKHWYLVKIVLITKPQTYYWSRSVDSNQSKVRLYAKRIVKARVGSIPACLGTWLISATCLLGIFFLPVGGWYWRERFQIFFFLKYRQGCNRRSLLPFLY